MQHSSDASYWNDDDRVEPWAREMNGGHAAAGVYVGNLYLQHSDPKQLRRLAEALNQAAFELDILRARLATEAASDVPAAVA